ncbi:hypothetical protein [Euryhalocaulis caribicus]|uniref:hypothetical protein n=1 Tax=Euryhalocaulis caribicus TaxID=1161401 RepID=UPI00039A4295|nr:hypothetical protein [Euryhalocaulis caribicus]
MMGLVAASALVMMQGGSACGSENHEDTSFYMEVVEMLDARFCAMRQSQKTSLALRLEANPPRQTGLSEQDRAERYKRYLLDAYLTSAERDRAVVQRIESAQEESGF